MSGIRRPQDDAKLKTSMMIKKRKLDSSNEVNDKLFQLTDFDYADMLPKLSLENNDILLHCHEAGNLGDISQTFFCAALIRKHYPESKISIAFMLESISEETVNKLFPSTDITTHFLSRYDYHERQKQMAELVDTRCTIGIAVGIHATVLYRSHHRTIREYGFGSHPDTKNNILSMGLGVNEEGITIPSTTLRQLSDIQSPWVKEALIENSALYHMHLREWPMQIVALYSSALIQNNQQDPIVIVLPLTVSLQNLIDWEILDKDYLIKNGIGAICRHTPLGIERITLSNSGKEMRILCGQIPKKEMEMIQQHANPLFGCTGDMSFSEAIALNKIPLYECAPHKFNFFNSVKKLAESQQLTTLSSLFSQVLEFDSWINNQYRINTPRKISWYQKAPSYDFDNDQSVPRISHQKTKGSDDSFPNRIKRLSEFVAGHFTSNKLEQEAIKLSAYIRENYNFEQKLMAIVARGLILKNFPELIITENELLDRYRKREMTLDEVSETLRNAIESAPKKNHLPPSNSIKKI